MKNLVQALRAECLSLEQLVRTLRPDDWEVPTAFFGWTIRDEIMHLHLVDVFASQTIQDKDVFRATVQAVREGQASGIELSGQMRKRFGQLSVEALLTLWSGTWNELCGFLEADDPKRRLSWFGPDMSVRSLASARQMEVWAHGQDIFDVLRLHRTNADSIYNICDLGVRTFDWSFRNRGETPPPLAPKIVLISPSGLKWTWNAEHEESIEGLAEEFALVVTQRRNVADTGLQVRGPGAARWMAIAQCFAGAPESPPAPGARVVNLA